MDSTDEFHIRSVTNMKDKTIETIVAMLVIMVLEMTAMITLHLDGVLLSSVIAVIAGLAGYKVAGIKGQAAPEQPINRADQSNKKKPPPAAKDEVVDDVLKTIEDL